MRSRRFASRDRRELHREPLVSPLPELGLVAADGPNDPAPELVVEDGVVARMDGRAASEFDVIDRFVVAHGLDLEAAAEAMVLDRKRVLPCAAYLQGEYGIKDLYLGVPCKIGKGGLEQIIEVELTKDEQAALEKSADSVKEIIDVVKL